MEYPQYMQIICKIKIIIVKSLLNSVDIQIEMGGISHFCREFSIWKHIGFYKQGGKGKDNQFSIIIIKAAVKSIISWKLPIL